MAISSATSRVDYTGDGATTAFAFPHYFFTDSDLLVTTRNNSTGVETTQVLTTNYTVTGEGSAAGGVVTFLSAPATGHKITIRRVRNLTQTTDIRNQGDFYPETHEDALDHLTFLCQQLQDQVTRSIRLPETEAGTAAKCILSAVETRASKYLYFDANGEIALASVVTLAPYDAQYVTLATNGTLTSERVLTGTANQITITDGGAGSTVTLSTPQNIHSAATPTFASLTLSGLTASRLLATDGSKALASVANLASWVAGTANQVTVTDDLDGTITLSLPQSIATSSSPQFAGLTLTGSLAFSLDNTVDLTAVGSRPRDVYAGRTFMGPVGSVSAVTLGVGAANHGIYSASAGADVSVSINGTRSIAFQANNIQILSDTGTMYFGAAADTILTRDAANVLAQRNGVNAQELRVYNTYTDSSNYERLRILWSANECYIQTIAAGTGAARPLNVGTNGNAGVSFLTNNIARYYINGTGHLLATTDNTYDIGASGATRPRTIYPGTSVVFPTGGLLSWSTDLHLQRDAADVLAQRNGVNAQELRVYNTYTDSSNYERLRILWSANECYIQTIAAGTGAARSLNVGTNGNAGVSFLTNNIARYYINGTGHLLASTDNAYDIGASGATRPRTGYFGTSVFAATSIGVARSTADSGVLLHLGAGGTTQGYIRMESAGGTNRGANLYVPSGGGLQIDTYGNSYNIILNGAVIQLYPGGSAVLDVGSGGLTLADAKNIIVNATTGTKIGTATTQKIGLWNATPIVQPSSTGETTGWTTGGGSAATSTDTYTGNSGSKAYTVNDIVKHLKAVGILAGS